MDRRSAVVAALSLVVAACTSSSRPTTDVATSVAPTRSAAESLPATAPAPSGSTASRRGAGRAGPPSGKPAARPSQGALVPEVPAAEIWRYAGMAVTTQAAGGNLIMSEVVRLDDGRYRMYYGVGRGPAGGKDIGYAESADATSWVPRGTALRGSTDPNDREFELAGPSILRLADGRWRMYYQATSEFEQPGGTFRRPDFTMRSAISIDGMHFAREGIRIGIAPEDAGASLAAAAHGRVIAASGTYTAIFSGVGSWTDARTQGLYEATSADGLTFSAPREIFRTFHDPLPITVAGLVRLYADDSVGTTPKNTGGVTYSANGADWPCQMASLTFEDSTGAVIPFGDTGNTILGDIGGIVLPDGQLRLYTNFDALSPNGGIAYFARISPTDAGDRGSCLPQ